MSKTDTPNGHRPLTPLTDSELDAVTGGIAGLNNMIADISGVALGQAIDSQSGNVSPWSGWPIGW